MQRISHRELARKIGCHQSTVSRALRGDPRIPLATREKVKAVAEELAYRPDPLWAEMAAQRWRSTSPKPTTLAVMQPHGMHVQGKGDYPHLWQGLQVAADRLGYSLWKCLLKEAGEEEKWQRQMNARGIKGVLLLPFFEEPFPRHLEWEKLVVLSGGGNDWQNSLNCVRGDAFQAVKLAYAHLRRLGYRRVGAALYRHPVRLRDDEQRLAAWWSCQTLERESVAVSHLEYSSATTPAELRAWLLDHRLDAVLGFSGEVEWKLRQAGMRTGMDYGFASLHRNPEELHLAGIPLITISQGEMLVVTLHRALLDYEYGYPKYRIDHQIEPVWVEGPSAPPVL